MYTIKLVTRPQELHQIAALSHANLRTVIDVKEKAEQGFITWEYTEMLLQNMHAMAPSVVALYHDEVVGYALVATHAMKDVHPELKMMLENLSSLTYQGQLMTVYPYYMMGQICISKQHRGKGLFEQLYAYHKEKYRDQFDILLTEISTSNHRSMRAHEKVGFKTIHTYNDHIDEWNVVVWDWRA